MKVKLEAIKPGIDSSFAILLTPKLNEIFYWHFHPEYEIVYVEAETGVRHVGDHISKYEGSDLVFIGPNIPHLNFDYGVKTIAETVVIQMKEHFLGQPFFALPEIAAINDLFERAKSGVAFHGETKRNVGEKLKQIPSLPHFQQLIELLQVFQLLATSEEYTLLHSRPIANASILKEQQRLHKIYHFIETNYQKDIDVNKVAALTNLTTAAFCRYFKKTTHLTFTDFLNQYRINQAKKLLLHDKNVTEACYESGFENLSHFNKTFKKVAGENPSQFKKRHAIN
ncbi:helix-turn-helix domain-containing protein [Panacibacter ginsenosidivorans]|uniref:Helix-turn-helix domain-containing protein n=1 Tax=Panacibacter ginsenosidivorans TaxID=1813871 RepID=A0A5B8VDE1_9BACT|nr:AraC family transcriptional regulator [Panacibacter ginsenosidivorans]QEC68666.1 helix-turn-helix domain-containing protein [Panacibacter ginsenosidivorans]